MIFYFKESDISYNFKYNRIEDILLNDILEENKLFVDIINIDFFEIKSLKEQNVYNELELKMVLEKTTLSFFEKIKEYIEKSKQRVEYIFKLFDGFKARIKNEYKPYVDKYKDEVINKDLSKMKLDDYIIFSNNNFWQDSLEFTYKYKELPELIKHILNSKFEYDEQILLKHSEEKFTDICIKLCEDELDGINYNNFNNEFVERTTTIEKGGIGCSKSTIEYCISNLNIKNDFINDLDKMKNNMRKWYLYVMKFLVNIEETIRKSYGNNEDFKEANYRANLIIKFLYQYTTSMHKICIKIMDSMIKVIKLIVKDSKKIFDKAVIYNPKCIKESNEILEFISESSEIEFDIIIG